MTNKTILIVNDTLRKGGKERRMLELIKGLLKRGFKVVLVVLSKEIEYPYVYDLEIEFIPIQRVFKFEVKTFFRLNGIINKYNPSVIHSWGFVSGIYLGPLSYLHGKKLVNSVIADSVQNLTFANKFFLMAKVSFLFSDLILSNSEAGIKAYSANEKKSRCIYNGVDLTRFNVENKSKLLEEQQDLYHEHEKIIGMVAAFESRKDYKTLIQSAIELLDENHNLLFLLVGDGTLLDNSKNLVPSRYKKKIIFTGKRNDVEQIISLFDIGVLMTNADVHGEGISNSIVEYMALSKPVIASRGGGTNEIIEEAVNGFLVDPFSVDGLKDKIILLTTNSNLARSMGENGRHLIETKFSLENMTESFIKEYKQLYHEN